MSLWEYKIITSGKGGFASPALLEKFLNDLGRDEWEIVAFQAQPDNFLVFTGMARRPTQRDWTLEDAAAAAAKVEADKLRAEFEAKFKAATGSGAPAEEAPASFLEQAVAPDDGFRKPIDTSHDADADDDEKEEDDWDKLTAAEEDELPTFFDAIKPHMRRNQRGPGMSVGVDYLAKKWDQSEDDLKGALAECGFTIPTDEDAKPEYLEFEGDLYWININRRGELWINTKEKPRPVFRAVKAQKVAPEETPEAAKPEERNHKEGRGHKDGRGHKEAAGQKPEAATSPEGTPAEVTEATAPAADSGAEAKTETPAPGQPLPEGSALLDKIRPHMRRNRRGPGGSGSASFLSRALKVREADLVAAFKTLGLVVPTSANEKPTNVEIAGGIWWVNVDSRGNVWINGRDKKPGETVEAAAAAAPAEPAPASGSGSETLPLSPAPEMPQEAVQSTSLPDAVPTPEVAPAATVEAAAAAAAPSSETPATLSVEPAAPAPAPVAEPSAPASTQPTLGALRPLMKESRSGLAGRIDRLAEAYGKTPDELIALLIAAGLSVPEKPREKAVTVDDAGLAFWINRNAKGELWLNAKAAKKADDVADEDEPEAKSEEGEGADKKPRPRSRLRRR